MASMTPSLAATPALRLAAALVASATLHAGAAYVAAAAPRGSPFGTGPLLAQPLHLRLVGPDEPAVAPHVSTVPDVAARSTAPERAAASYGTPADVGQVTTPPATPQAGAPFGVRESPLYFLPSQLDVRPHLLTRVEPVYPQGAPPDGGYAVVRLLIGEAGQVERVIVVVSDPVDKFGEAAVAAFGAALFSSGKLNGVAVKSQLMIEVKFNSLQPPGVASTAVATE